MTLEKVLTITGKPGLYHLEKQTRGGFIATSLGDGKKMAISMRHNVSLLSEIAIYTLEEEVPLREVFAKIKEKENGGKTSVSHKDSKEVLEEYFFGVLPNYDEDRVYTNDIKKVIQWYNLLLEKDILTDENLKSNQVSEAQEVTEEETTEKEA